MSVVAVAPAGSDGRDGLKMTISAVAAAVPSLVVRAAIWPAAWARR
jgi:hypothetical protein